MSDQQNRYIWRCAKCTNHLGNILETDGFIKIEKKCNKCKSLNLLTLTNKEIYIQCKIFDPRTNGYNGEVLDNIAY